ncbi:hypothetical protein, partial [Mycobacterium sp.]|uniref:hypothetical protein n=1 Tax=Mycobacterium sp. TaxID=1785 RepID=UPI003BAECC53
MKPNPFSALNHFTVPCGISRYFLYYSGAEHHLDAPGPFRPLDLAESPELHPTYNLAGTAAATSILRKFDTNTEAATANSQPCSSPQQQPQVSN